MIYTKTGDNGTTSLAGGERVLKTDLRITSYGTADELNSFVGLLRTELTAEAYRVQDEALEFVQNRLFNLGAFLSDAEGEWITADDTRFLEQQMDAMTAELEPMHAFLLPAGDRAMCFCHVCRTITRRLERHMIALTTETEGQMGEAKRFVNRLSDYFFVLARWLGTKNGIKETKWRKK